MKRSSKVISDKELFQALTELRKVKPPVRLASRFKSKLIPELSLQTKRQHIPTSIWKYGLALLIILFLSGSGIVVAAQKSHPGDLLYPVKTILNEIKDYQAPAPSTSHPPILETTEPGEQKSLEPSTSPSIQPSQSPKHYIQSPETILPTPQSSLIPLNPAIEISDPNAVLSELDEVLISPAPSPAPTEAPITELPIPVEIKVDLNNLPLKFF